MPKCAVFVGPGGNWALGQALCDVIDPVMQAYNEAGVSIADAPAGYPIIAYQSARGSLNAARPMVALGMPGEVGSHGPETPFATWRCETIDQFGIWPAYRNGGYV